MRFSQRIGKKPIKTKMQLRSMNLDLRVALWNAFQIFFLDKVQAEYISWSNFKLFFMTLWHEFFVRPLDNLDDFFPNTKGEIREWFFKCQWDEVYDFIEFVSKAHSPVDENAFRAYCNKMLERELSGYRFVGNEITPITDQKELKEIQEAIANAQKTKLSGVNEHLKSALSKLSDRKKPDYRNSIKESISAVEAITQIISGNKKAKLAQALKVIEDRVGLHSALKKGFCAIYGWTSEEGGIRHAMLEKTKCDFEDAKYMLVSCSAFINYLIMKARKAGVNF